MPAHRLLIMALSLGTLLQSATLASAQTVTDGDTIKFGKERVRLWGIDAPESKQLCPDGWPAGRAATTYIRTLLKDHTVTCEARGHDRYGRTIGLCRADGVDIQAAMVRAGMAWAFVRYSHDYVGQEAEANAEHLGVHAHQCLPAWEWRAEQAAKRNAE
jgi:endonuclease YncB( thermonuclease family)